jgi:glycine betaine/proline transport system substrate-binding protein
MKLDTRRALVAGAMALALMVMFAACSSPEDEDDLAAATTLPSGFESKPTISLAVNDWTASAVNVAIAEQLIERQLGYPVVPTRLDDTTEMYEGLADGSLDAVLEVWPSAMSERDNRYFERGEVVDLGPLGSVGKVGWFVPRYVIDQNPALSSWEGYATPEAGSLFATPETTPKGRFLGTTEDYQQYDQQIIDNLRLPFEVVFSGSEGATIEELAARHGAQEPILLYWWTPTSAVGLYDLVNVTLPTPTEACLASALAEDGKVNCDYPEDQLFKAASPDLEAKAADVAQFLSRFTLTTEDQVALLGAVEGQGTPIDMAAQTWIEANEATWRTWLTPEG